jgi:uracil phosphoribosyltransferase
MQDNFRVSPNQLVAIKLTRLRRFAFARDRDTYLDCAEYRQLMREIGMLLAYEVANELQTETVDFEIPTRGSASGTLLIGNYSVVVPILRTGLVLAEGFQSVLSHTHTGHIGLHQNKSTKRELIEYLVVLPDPSPSDRLFILLDPVIATGETAHRAITIVKEHGATKIIFVSLIASSEARERLSRDHHDVRFYTATIDEKLEDGRVYPGLGSVSELLFGFKTTNSIPL